MKGMKKENKNFMIFILIIIAITLIIFFRLNKDLAFYHILGLFFTIIAEIIFMRGIYKTAISKENICKPSGEMYGIFTINKLIMILVSIIFIIEEGESLFMFIIIELILSLIGLILLNLMLTNNDNKVNK